MNTVYVMVVVYVSRKKKATTTGKKNDDNVDSQFLNFLFKRLVISLFF
jgi:hypothetical protein